MPADEIGLARLKNLGPESTRWLNQVGIHSFVDLQNIGALGAYRLTRQARFPVSLNLVYAIEGALRDVHWLELPEDVRDELKVAVRLMADE